MEIRVSSDQNAYLRNANVFKIKSKVGLLVVRNGEHWQTT